MNWLDYFFIIVVGFNLIGGLRRGLIRIVFDLVALFVSVFLAIEWFPGGGELIQNYLKLPRNISAILSFSVIMSAGYFAVSLLGAVVHRFLRVSILASINLLGGGFLGVIKGTAFASVVVFPLVYFNLPAANGSWLVGMSKPYFNVAARLLLPEGFPNAENLLDQVGSSRASGVSTIHQSEDMKGKR